MQSDRKEAADAVGTSMNLERMCHGEYSVPPFPTVGRIAHPDNVRMSI